MSSEERPYLAAICQACKKISSRLRLDDVLTALALEAEKAFGCKGVAVELTDEGGENLCIAATRGLSRSFAARGQKVPIDKEIRQKLDSGLTIAFPDVSREKGSTTAKAMEKEGLRAALLVPLRAGEDTIGVLKLYYSSATEFTAERERMAYTVAATGAIAVQNARLYDRMECLFEVSRSLTSTLNVDQVLDLIVREAAETMGLKGSTLRLLDEKRANVELKAAYGFSEEYLKRDRIISADGVKEALDGSRIVIEDTSSDPRVMDPQGTKNEGIASILVVPLRVKDRTIGTLAVMSSVRRKFSEDDIQFLSSLADHGAVAIENARLYEHMRRDYEDLAKDVLTWYDWGARPPKTGS
jgi:GAF domain-containing protein